MDVRRAFRSPTVLLTSLVLVGGALAGSAVARTGSAERMDLITLAPPDAREDFEAGVVALHDFWYGEAADRFRAVQEAAPAFTLGYWGEALAQHHNPFGHADPPRDTMRVILSRLASTREERSALAGSDHERRYLQALEVLIAEEGTTTERHLSYVAEMERLASDFPDDIEAQAFYARAILLEAPSFSSSPEVQAKTAEAARRVLERVPDHHGGLHYFIHGKDSPSHAVDALAEADRYRRLARGASHAIHMPSHIYMQLGRWDDVIETNRAARAASEAWIERSGRTMVALDWHAVDFLLYGLLQQGREREAKELLAEVAGFNDEFDDGTLEWYNAIWHATYAMELGERSDVELPRSRYRSVAEELGLGIHFARSGELDAAAEFLQGISERAMERGDAYWRIAEAELRLLTQVARGDGDPDVEALREAISLQAEMARPNETPYLVKPPEEVLGEALLIMERPEEALDAFRAGDARWPSRLATRLGMARAHVALGDRAAARGMYEVLLNQLRHADDLHPAKVEVREFLEG